MNGASRQVLIVEDDLDLRDILKDLLSAEGYRVHTASNGEEALRILDEAPGDRFVILLDMMMPVMDGATLIQHLNARPLRHRVVVLTADIEVEAAHTDISAMLPKPFDVTALKAALASAA
ncbi:MAG: response regulator [Myxococcaceae bacterium]|nr:response regulator [Myxococcaceae bacterium]